MDKKYLELFLKTSSGRYASKVMRLRTFTLEQIFADVQEEVTIALPFLEEGVTYKTKMLCGPTSWSKWFTWERRVAGMCMKFLVQDKLVSLHRHQIPSGKGSALYRTQPMPQPLGRITTKIIRVQSSGSVLQLMRDRRTPWL